MLAPKGVDINIYICVCVGEQLLHVFMTSWSNGCSDQAHCSDSCSSPIYKQGMCVPLTWNYDIKVSGDHINWLTLFSMFIWHLLAMQSVEWVVLSEHSCSFAGTTMAILFPWHFCIEWMCYFQIYLVKWSVDCTRCVDHFWPNVRKGGLYFR